MSGDQTDAAMALFDALEMNSGDVANAALGWSNYKGIKKNANGIMNVLASTFLAK